MATANGAEEFNTLFANKCEDFTDRSEWVHLPCEVGDIVFYFQGAYHLKNKSMWEIRPIKVTEFSMKMGKNGKLYPLSIIANGTRYPLTSIGKTLFLSRKEAEKALEEKGENESKVK
jgi:hypothetical protein